MPSSSSVSACTEPRSPAGPEAAMADSSTTRATRLSRPSVPDSSRASTLLRAATRRPSTSCCARTEASERSISAATSPAARARPAWRRWASAARKPPSRRAMAWPTAVACPARRSSAATVSSTCGAIDPTRSASGPAAMLRLSCRKLSAARRALSSQRPSMARWSTGSLRGPSRAGGLTPRRSSTPMTALVPQAAAPTTTPATGDSPTAHATPPAAAPSSSPQGSASSSLNATTPPCSEVGDHRGEDLVDAGRVGGIVGGAVGGLGDPLQRAEVGGVAVGDGEQPHRLVPLLGLELVEQALERDAVAVLVLAVGQQHHRVDPVRAPVVPDELDRGQAGVVEPGPALWRQALDPLPEHRAPLAAVGLLGHRADGHQLTVVAGAVELGREHPQADLVVAGELRERVDRRPLCQVELGLAGAGHVLAHLAGGVHHQQHVGPLAQVGPALQEPVEHRRRGRRQQRGRLA